MERHKWDCAILCPSPNFYYLIGYSPKIDERVLLAFLTVDKNPVLLLPEIYADEAKKFCWIKDQRCWKDGENVQNLILEIVRELSLKKARLLLDDSMNFMHVLLIQKACINALFGPVNQITMPLRMIKEHEEVVLLKKSGQIADRVMEKTIKYVNEGKSEIEIKDYIEFELRNHGMSGEFSNLVASGSNSSFPHHVSNKRKVSKGDMVYFDIGGTYNKYWSDITRTAFIGQPPHKVKILFEEVREAQKRALSLVKPGIPIEQIHREAVEYLINKGLSSYLRHRTGHGIGLEGHESPSISEGNNILIEPGMTFTVEPGIYIPGEFGIRIEDSIIVTEDGYETFNNFPRDLVII